MSTADLLVEQMFSWIDQKESCAEQLKKLARELESLREKCNASECVGSSVSVVGAATLLGAGAATFFTGGAAAPLLGLAGGAYTCVGVAISVATKISEHLSSSDTMKEAQRIEEKSNKIAEEIQKQFQRLKVEVMEGSSLTDPDEVERRIMAEILRAVAKRSGVNLQINDHMFHVKQFFLHAQQRNMRPNVLMPLLSSTLFGILGYFELTFTGKKTQLLFAEGVRQLTKQLTSIGVKTALKGGAMVAGGVVGLAFALPEAIDNWKDLIKKNHVTKASQSLRDTADEILKFCRTLRKQFDDMKSMLVDMERQREREERERLQRERERRERERLQREREERERLQREHERREMKRLQREREEKERLQREREREKNRAQERSGNQRAEPKGREQDTENQLNKQTGSDQQGGGDQADNERDDEDEESDNEEEESDSEEEESDSEDEESDSEDEESESEDEESESEEETEDDERQQTGRKKRTKYNQKKGTQNKQRGKKESEVVTQDGCIGQDQKKNSNINKEGNQESDNNQRPPASINAGLLNVRSMNNKPTDIKEIITENNLEVFATTETWLNRNREDTLRRASPENFSSCYSSRRGRGGGVATQFLNELNDEGEQINFNTDISRSQYVAVALQHDEWNQPILFISVYYPPGYTMQEFRVFLDEFEELLNEVFKKFNSIIVTGDFNIHINQERRSYTDEFEFLLLKYDLDQHVQEPTHNRGNTLDLVITRGVQISDLSVQKVNKTNPKTNEDQFDHFLITFRARPKDEGRGKRKKKQEQSKKKKEE